MSTSSYDDVLDMVWVSPVAAGMYHQACAGLALTGAIAEEPGLEQGRVEGTTLVVFVPGLLEFHIPDNHWGWLEVH